MPKEKLRDEDSDEEEELEEIEEPKPREKRESSDIFEISEIPTQVAPVIRDIRTNKVYNELTILCKIANDLEKLKKLL